MLPTRFLRRPASSEALRQPPANSSQTSLSRQLDSFQVNSLPSRGTPVTFPPTPAYTPPPPDVSGYVPPPNQSPKDPVPAPQMVVPMAQTTEPEHPSDAAALEHPSTHAKPEVTVAASDDSKPRPVSDACPSADAPGARRVNSAAKLPASAKSPKSLISFPPILEGPEDATDIPLVPDVDSPSDPTSRMPRAIANVPEPLRRTGLPIIDIAIENPETWRSSERARKLLLLAQNFYEEQTARSRRAEYALKTCDAAGSLWRDEQVQARQEVGKAVFALGAVRGMIGLSGLPVDVDRPGEEAEEAYTGIELRDIDEEVDEVQRWSH